MVYHVSHTGIYLRGGCFFLPLWLFFPCAALGPFQAYCFFPPVAWCYCTYLFLLVVASFSLWLSFVPPVFVFFSLVVVFVPCGCLFLFVVVYFSLRFFVGVKLRPRVAAEGKYCGAKVKGKQDTRREQRLPNAMEAS